MRYAILKDGIVEDVIEADESFCERVFPGRYLQVGRDDYCSKGCVVVEGKVGNPETHIFRDHEWKEVEHAVNEKGDLLLKVDGDVLSQEDYDGFKRSLGLDSGSNLKG